MSSIERVEDVFGIRRYSRRERAPAIGPRNGTPEMVRAALDAATIARISGSFSHVMGQNGA